MLVHQKNEEKTNLKNPSINKKAKISLPDSTRVCVLLQSWPVCAAEFPLYIPCTLGQELASCSLILPPNNLLFCKIAPTMKDHLDRKTNYLLQIL